MQRDSSPDRSKSQKEHYLVNNILLRCLVHTIANDPIPEDKRFKMRQNN